MGKWSESSIYQQTRGTSRWTRFVGWLNNLMNPNHEWVSDWNEYDQNTQSTVGNALDSIVNNLTQQDVTGRDVALNEMQMQNQEDIYQRQVTGMQKAGLNPALMYKDGAGGSAPSAPTASGGMGMSELMSLMMLPLQKKMLEAQIRNTDAKTSHEEAMTDESKARTEQTKLISLYYPDVQEATLDKMASEIGVNRATIDNKDMETALTAVKKSLAEKENQYADRFYKARADYEEAQTENAKQSAAASAARAAWDAFELKWTKEHNGARPSSAGVLAIAAAIADFLGLDGEGTSAVIDALRDKLQEVGGLLTEPVETIKEKGVETDSKLKSLSDKWKTRYRRFNAWRNKEKKAPWVR